MTPRKLRRLLRKLARERGKFGQTDFAEYLGVSKSLVSNYVRDKIRFDESKVSHRRMWWTFVALGGQG